MKDDKLMAKEKKRIAPNEASWLRWLACVVVGVILGGVFCVPFEVLVILQPAFLVQGYVGEMLETIRMLVAFAGYFIGTLISLRWVAKTPVKDFIYGVGGKSNRKQNLTVAGLYLLGMLLSMLISIGNIAVREMEAAKYLIALAFVVVFTWMQTSWEELVFRGVFIRHACKNNIACTKKAVIWGIISSLIFMAMHMGNPEVLSQSGFQVVLSCIPYFLSGMGLYFADIYFKSLMPGLIVHWINNFVTFILFSSVVTAGGLPSLLVDNTPPTGLYYLISTAICYVPLYVYIFAKVRKERKERKEKGQSCEA